MKKQHLYFFSLIIAWLFAASCANIVTPSGGPRDVTPPMVVNSDPKMNTKNFEGKTVKISFNEFVQLNDIAKNVIISPFTEETPDIKIRGKSVVVEFNDSLKSNTTYSVGFGNAIADITEKNILSNYRFVFSTGQNIDTLVIKGVVKNAFTQIPESDVFVMLYTQYEDSVPLKKTPYYLAKTEADGSFYFSSVHDNSFKIFALKDVNSDYLFDQPNEKIAFLDTLIKPEVIDTTKDSISQYKNTVFNLNLFEEAPSVQRLLKASAIMYGKINLIFRKPLENYSLNEIIKKGSGYKVESNKTKDTLTLWMNNPEDDSLIIEVIDNKTILDTAEIGLMKKKTKTSGRGGGILPLHLKPNVSGNSSFDYYKPITIEFSNPIVKHDFNKIIFTENNKDTITPVIFFDSSNISTSDIILRKIKIDYKWKEGTNYSLFIPPATFRDMFDLPNDTLKINFKTTENRDYGNIILQIHPKNINDHLLIQVVNEKDVAMDEKSIVGEGTIKFNFLKPGNYKIKVIVDTNNNGKWDTGNYLEKIQPEKVYYNPNSIQVKANWDMELEWNVEN
ncbi:MAG TPA: Ig-like domain-containing protein [Bacteroidales bacterium]|nr:Ig-like domain-containing protein [Bacteroidales bacterium]HPS18101.1 Ig-like domain-containing protein [Bacteroidales bacterium]